MPVHTLDPQPTIKVLFKGLIITHIKDRAPIAQLGAVRNAPSHEPQITVTRLNADGKKTIAETKDFDLNEDIFLDVETTSASRIRTFQGKESFKRLRTFGPSTKQDFRLHVDFDRDLFDDEAAVSVDPAEIGPVFTLQNAVFYTEVPTEQIVDRFANGTKKAIGIVAEELGALVKLSRGRRTATLRNGIREIFKAVVGDGSTYIIEFNCECPRPTPVPAGVAVNPDSDFELVYNAIGKELPKNKRVFVRKRDGGPEHNPEVFCTGANTEMPLRP